MKINKLLSIIILSGCGASSIQSSKNIEPAPLKEQACTNIVKLCQPNDYNNCLKYINENNLDCPAKATTRTEIRNCSGITVYCD